MDRTPVIVGIGRSDFSRDSGRTTLALAAEAARAALGDAGLEPDAVDGVACYAMGDSSPGMAVAHAAGIETLHWNLELFGGGNFATSVVSKAAMAAQCGACDAAIAFR